MEVNYLLTASELYHLNKALDGKNIFGIYMAQCIVEKQMKKINGEDLLIEKKLLNSDKSLNDNSVKIIQKLEQYKSAKKYVSINEVLFSINPNSQYSVAMKNKNEKYELEIVAKHLIIYGLIKKFPFIGGNKEVKKEVYKVEIINIINEKLFNAKEDEWFSVKKSSSEKSELSYIYFLYEEDTYKYDFLAKTLEKKSPRDIRKELFEIFEVKEVKDV